MTALSLEQIGQAVSGDGRPVVLVHGLAEDHRAWAAQLDGPFALRGARAVAIDLRGHGQSKLGEANGTLGQLAEDLAVVLRTLGEPAVAVGFSLGGTIVLEAARRWPDLIAHAVVLGTSSVVGRRARGFFLDRIALAQAGDRSALAAALRDDTAMQVVTAEADVDQLTAWRLQAIGDGQGYVNAARAMVELADHPLTPSLGEIAVPVAVVGADGDVFCPQRAADLLVDGLPNATFHQIKSAGHLMNVEQPAAVTAVIQQAIDGKVQE